MSVLCDLTFATLSCVGLYCVISPLPLCRYILCDLTFATLSCVGLYCVVSPLLL